MKTPSFDKGLVLFDMFNKIKIGILVLKKSKKEVLFLNKYFIKIARDDSQYIIDVIFNSLGSKRKASIHNEIEIGEKLTYGFSIYPVEGKADRFVVLISDISSKKIYMEIMNNENYYRKLSKFASEITHEAGNPLTSVIMTLQVLLGNLNLWDIEKNKDYLKTSITELKRLSDFIKRVRDISVDHKIKLEEMELKSFIQMVIFQNKPDLENKNIIMKENIKDNVRVKVDPDAFYKIILNLIKNSIEILSPESGVINMKVEEMGEFFIKLIYENNGPVIPDEMKEKMFLPIISSKVNGSVIGLDLSLKLMIKMGGIIKAENLEDGHGVRFVIYIPKAEGTESNG